MPAAGPVMAWVWTMLSLQPVGGPLTVMVATRVPVGLPRRMSKLSLPVPGETFMTKLVTPAGNWMEP